MDFARYYGDQGRQQAYQAIGEAVQFGNQMPADPGWCFHRADHPAAYAAAAGNLYHLSAVCWYRYLLQPAVLDKQYNPGSLEFDWQVMQNQMNFIPEKFQFEITQYPDVRVEYLGKPIYVPPSASSDYVEPAS